MVDEQSAIESTPLLEVSTMTTYYYSAKGTTISYKRALHELRQHGIDTNNPQDIEEFHFYCGIKENYDAQDVLIYLGY